VRPYVGLFGDTEYRVEMVWLYYVGVQLNLGANIRCSKPLFFNDLSKLALFETSRSNLAEQAFALIGDGSYEVRAQLCVVKAAKPVALPCDLSPVTHRAGPV
jgi:hypothetical protein